MNAAEGTTPKYPRRPAGSIKIAPFEAQLTHALEVDAWRPKRDRRTALKLFSEIQAAGFDGDYSRVTDFVRRWRGKGGQPLVKAFVPLRFELGEAFPSVTFNASQFAFDCTFDRSEGQGYIGGLSKVVLEIPIPCVLYPLEKPMRTITKLDIRKCARLAKPPKWLRVGVLLLAFGAPFALAGPEQDSELAVKEFARGDLVAAIALWRKAANEGYAPAQVWLGDILDKAEEDQEAVEWYRKAAAQGSPAGEYGLGQMYAKGEGVKKDFAEAQTHILRAAQKELPARGDIDSERLQGRYLWPYTGFGTSRCVGSQVGRAIPRL